MAHSLINEYQGVELLFDTDGLQILFDTILFDELNTNASTNSLLEEDLFLFLDSDLLQRELAVKNVTENRFYIKYSDYYQIDESERTNYFFLPISLEGSLKLKPRGINASSRNYDIKLEFIPKSEKIPRPFIFHGGILKVGNRVFSLSKEEFECFKFYYDYKLLSEKDEATHYELVSAFKAIRSEQLNIDENRFEGFAVQKPEKISLNITKEENGDLTISPNLNGVNATSEPKIDREINNLKSEKETGVLHDGNNLIPLSKNTKAAIDEIKSKPVIKKEEVEAFFENPGSFYNGDLIDLDTGFSFRVKGIIEYTRVSLLEIDDHDNDWFLRDEPVEVKELKTLIQNESDLEDFKKEIEHANESNATSIIFKGQKIDVKDKESIESQLSVIQKLLESESTFSINEDESIKTDAATFDIDYLEKDDRVSSKFQLHKIEEDLFENLKYQPKGYQKEGIEWIYSLYRSSLLTNKEIQGGILADDMGLGKTFTSLVAMAAIASFNKSINGKIDKPFLVVAPLSLLQNWKDEVEKFFEDSPFKDIILLNAQEELNRFRLRKGNERQQATGPLDGIETENIKYCLKIGNSFEDRLDVPGRLVILTYDTLRNFQFSLARIPWAGIVFDEAQNIKNPNTLSTRAAKALDSDVKILATGTPVENKLEEYWCIMDTAIPKLFGNRKQFLDKYVRPMKHAKSEKEKIQIGRKLYNDSQPFLLRRVKEDVLTNLPPKQTRLGIQNFSGKYDASLDQELSELQEHNENKVRSQFRYDSSLGAALRGLHSIKNCYLHPTLTWDAKSHQLSLLNSQDFWNQSARLRALHLTINNIEQIGTDKLIVFTTYRAMQRALKKHIRNEFNLNANIISGETKVSSQFYNETRKGIIEEFTNNAGFQILILSPIAAGVGLNIVTANHVFHLDRHWNPAKEAQANDRVYRIGQEKEVFIYYPISKSKNGESFDIKMNKLLDRKIELKDALLAHPESIENELAKEYLAN